MVNVMVLLRGLAGHIKNAFLTVWSEQLKRRNAGHYELRNVDNSLSVINDCVWFMTRASEIKLRRQGYKL